METYKKISTQIIVSYLFTFFAMVLGMALIPLLTRLMSLHDFGIYSLLYSIAIVLPAFFGLGLTSFITAKFISFKEEKRMVSLFTILVIQAFLLLLITLFVLVPPINYNLLSFLKLQDYRMEFFLIMIIFVLSTVIDILTSYLAAERKINAFSFLSFLKNCSWIVLIAAFILLTKNISLFWIFMFWIIGLMLTLLVGLFFIRKDIIHFLNDYRRIDLSIFKEAILIGLPFLPIIVFSWVMSTVDRYMINYYIDPKYAGFFALAYSLVFIIISMQSIIQGVIYPHIISAHHNKEGFQVLFNALLKYSLVITLPAMVGIVIMRDKIITLISGMEYLPASNSIAILSFFPFFIILITIFGTMLVLENKTILYSVILILGVLLNIILNFFLIPRWGIDGASIAIIISYIFMFAAIYISTFKYFSWDLGFLKIGRIIVSSFVMGVVVFFINPQTYVTKIIAVFAGVVVFFLLILILKVFDKKEISIFTHFTSFIYKKKD